MNHLSEARLYELHLDSMPLSAVESEHLAGCEACAARSAQVASLARSFALVRRSRLAREAYPRLYALYDQVQSRSLGRRLGAWVSARLTLDTRTASAAAGLRGAAGAYRLLYSTDAADVELMVERAQGALRVEGEVLPLRAEHETLPVLVQLESAAGIVAEMETNSEGRFALEKVAPGSYRLWLAFAGAGDVIIEELEIV